LKINIFERYNYQKNRALAVVLLVVKAFRNIDFHRRYDIFAAAAAAAAVYFF
jgi:hypothetical protein